MTKNNELTTCPKCKKKGFIKYKQGINLIGMFEKYRVICSFCDYKTKWEPFLNLAIENWNKGV